jgi:hypothetical protein
MAPKHRYMKTRIGQFQELPHGRLPGQKCIPHDAYPEIIRRYESGEELLSAIGRDYNVTGHAIQQIVRRLRA